MIKVLVVNHSNLIREMLALALEANSYSVFKINSAAATLETAHKVLPHVILLETELPDCNLKDLCNTLKTDSLLNDAAVLLTSYDSIPPEAIRQTGADDFIGREFGIEEIIKKINFYAARAGQ